jgi:hemerythrin superfamily protein
MRKAATSAAFGLASDWCAVLTAEHRRIDRLFAQAAGTKLNEGAKREALLARIAQGLEKHALQEESDIYPAIRDVDHGAGSKELAAEHFEMKTYLHELDRMAKDDPRWLGKLTAFRKLVKEHVRQEEELVFPAVKAQLSKAENARLTRDMLRHGARLN